MKYLEVGILGDIKYGQSIERFTFVKSLTHLIICPILHRNTNKFIGMKDKSSYVQYKLFKDKIVTLGFDNYLTSWDLATGKYIKRIKVDNINDLSDFSHYGVTNEFRKDEITIIKSNKEAEGQRKEDFFMAWQL